MSSIRRLTGFSALVLLAGCADRAPTATAVEPPTTPPSVGSVPGASVSVVVGVSQAMRASPFDTERRLNVPAGFAVRVYARVPGARFMAVAPNGDLLVSSPGSGRVYVVRPGTSGGDPTVSEWVGGLRNPHDIVFHNVGGVQYVYVSESHQINRYVYNASTGAAGARQIVVANLPDNSSGELRGSYGHQLKNIALTGNRLFVSVASPSNADPADVARTPPGAAIFAYDADGANGRVYARGLRNAEGLAILPGSSDLWVVVNNRDNIAYPFHNDWDGDGSDDYGKVLASYVNNHPPEEFTRVRDGANYGWPLCNPNPDTPSGMNDMPFDRDVQNNADGSRLDCGTAERITRGIQAHSAPLGLTFLQNTAFPEPYRQGAAVAYHGSWNRSTPTGYKIAIFPWDAAAGRPADEAELVTGWTVGGVWGRPVDVAVDASGGMFISDDQSGTVYRLSYTGSAVAALTLLDTDSNAALRALVDGDTLDLGTLPTRRLNVRASTEPTQVGSVRFGLDDNPSMRVDDTPAYTLMAEGTPGTPARGAHRLIATPWSTAGGTGVAGRALAVSFAVADPGVSVVTQPLANTGTTGCMQAPGTRPASGTQLLLARCAKSRAQFFSMNSAGPSGEIRLGPLCVGAGQTEGAAVTLQRCGGGAGQWWTFTAAGELRGVGGRCAELRGGTRTDGTPIVVATCTGVAGQKWGGSGRSVPTR